MLPDPLFTGGVPYLPHSDSLGPFNTPRNPRFIGGSPYSNEIPSSRGEGVLYPCFPGFVSYIAYSTLPEMFKTAKLAIILRKYIAAHINKTRLPPPLPPSHACGTTCRLQTRCQCVHRQELHGACVGHRLHTASASPTAIVLSDPYSGSSSVNDMSLLHCAVIKPVFV